MEAREESLGWIVAPTYDLCNHIFEQVATLVHKYIGHRIEEYSPREQRLVIRNLSGGRSELRAKSADHPTSLLGEKLNFVVMDEVAKMKPEIWFEHVSQRLLELHGWALLISTPGERDWFYKLWRLGQKNRDPLFESWTGPSSANPYIPKQFIEDERRNLPPEIFRSQYGGEFLGPDTEPCDLCHGPNRNAPPVILIVGPGQDPSRCPECGGWVDDQGASLVHLDHVGNPLIRIIMAPPTDPSAGPEVAGDSGISSSADAPPEPS
jgi:hypothetical protein